MSTRLAITEENIYLNIDNIQTTANKLRALLLGTFLEPLLNQNWFIWKVQDFKIQIYILFRKWNITPPADLQQQLTDFINDIQTNYLVDITYVSEIDILVLEKVIV